MVEFTVLGITFRVFGAAPRAELTPAERDSANAAAIDYQFAATGGQAYRWPPAESREDE